MVDTLACFHFKQTINTPTRITGSSKTTIDHLYTNISDGIINSGTIVADISDHFPIFVFFNFMKTQTVVPPIVIVRDFSHFNVQAYRKDLRAETWEHGLNCEDVNVALNHFIVKFQEICSIHAPLKQKI